MAFITVWETEDKKKQAGHCSKCMAYNTVLKKDWITKCDACQSKMLHVSPKIMIALTLIVIIFLILIPQL